MRGPEAERMESYACIETKMILAPMLHKLFSHKDLRLCIDYAFMHSMHGMHRNMCLKPM